MEKQNEPIIVGTGKQCIYVYYFAQYEKFKDDEDIYYWPCKVGMSTRNAYERIYEQVKTAFPEPPIVGLIVKTDDGLLLEKALHAILNFKHRHINMNGNGNEWYNTTPDEVLLLCQAIRAY